MHLLKHSSLLDMSLSTFILRVFRIDTSCDVVGDLAVGTEDEAKLCALVLGRCHRIDRISEFL
jgi:hypothetical protein